MFFGKSVIVFFIKFVAFTVYPHITEVAKYTIVITINAFKAGSAGKFGYHKVGGGIVGIWEEMRGLLEQTTIGGRAVFQGAVLAYLSWIKYINIRKYRRRGVN